MISVVWNVLFLLIVVVVEFGWVVLNMCCKFKVFVYYYYIVFLVFFNISIVYYLVW